ncbi:type I restriction-modification system subunit M [Oceanobacillus senegalensis]|uniref:type I restriction-modification system subunit M n=1 Tax=Oceanobacillus senegalensis TaxID=1936063 RepID=UPI000A30B34B|nr:type I restriction-modification system subunit M [Oceanobacillus senegalensis]
MEEKITQQQINNVLWQAADTFRGKIDSSTYKDYILTMLFIKYLSDTYKAHLEEYTKRYDGDERRIERALSRERFVLDEQSTFDYLYSKRNDSEIGEIINKALERIENENTGKLRGVFRNIDFNSESILGKAKERNAILRSLLDDFNNLSLRPSQIGNEDVVGNAYQYMIGQFASDAGKKGGEFYTPAEVSELLARLVRPQENDRIYDPTCGSGSLLIKVAKQVPSRKVAIYGQERNGATHSLALMNMYLHGIDDAKIEWGDTLANPLHLEDEKLMKFQAIVANPPFSLDKWAMGFAGEGTNDKKFKMEASLDPFQRFDWGVPPSSKGDYAFVQHMLYSLSEDGRMATIVPHGVLYRGSSEGKIRQQIIEMNLLDAIIGLPEGLFFGTGIPACIMVLKKDRKSKDVLFIDASSEGNYERGKNQNKLREQDIKKIVDTYEDKRSEEKYSYVATLEEIKDNDFNLNIPRYVDTYEEEEPVDMDSVKENITSIKQEIEEIEIQMDKYLRDLGL